MDTNLCPTCHQSVQPEWYFCANCGKDLKGAPKKVPVINQIGIYALSVFLPPLGLVPGIKYMALPGKQTKIVGAAAIILTILSSFVTIKLTFFYLNSYLSTYGDLLNSGLKGF